MSEPSIRKEGAITVVGVGGRFTSILAEASNSTAAIPALWHTFINRRGEIADVVEGTTYGVCTPITEGEPAGPGEFYYIACAPVTAAGAVPEGMESLTIAPATYAVFEHRGTIDGLRATYEGIHGSWLRDAGHRHTGAPELELYDDRFTGGDDSVMEIWIPIGN